MRSRDYLLLLVSLAGATLSLTSSAQAQTQTRPSPTVAAARDANTCLTCHRMLPDRRLRSVAEEFEQSVHHDERIGCAGCHGGQPTDPTVSAHATEAGFVVKPAHDRIAEICGGCHEDPVFVRRFQARLPIDQKKLFALSRHGQLSSAGDTHAPTCTDCHGTHEIAPVSSPLAPVHATRVVTLCARCHAKPEYMAPYKLETRQVDEWKKSVHGVAFAQGNHAAPTCTGCHSPHAGKLPGEAAVEALCDRCHTDERNYFLESPHARTFRRLGLGECVPCHGSHDVSRPDRLVGMTPESACSRCHAKDVRAREVAEQLGKLLGSVDVLENEARAELAKAKRAGLNVPGATHALSQVHTARLGLSANMHTLNVERISADVRAARPLAEKVRTLVDSARHERKRERYGSLVALLVAGLLFVLLVLKARQLARKRAEAP